MSLNSFIDNDATMVAMPWINHSEHTDYEQWSNVLLVSCTVRHETRNEGKGKENKREIRMIQSELGIGIGWNACIGIIQYYTVIYSCLWFT